MRIQTKQNPDNRIAEGRIRKRDNTTENCIEKIVENRIVQSAIS